MFRTLSARLQGEHQTLLQKQLHNSTWSAVYVDMPVIIRVVICNTGGSGLRQRVWYGGIHGTIYHKNIWN
jgi:hypothetical protein